MIGEGETQWAGEPREWTAEGAAGDGAGRPSEMPTDVPENVEPLAAAEGAAVTGELPDAVLPDEPAGWTDVLTGCDGPRYWDRVVTSEQARNARHHRTATIVLVEFAGIDAIARRWGNDLALQLFLRLARELAGGIRSSDHIARIGRTRFAVLLVETDEVLAINFVDRIRDRCESDIDPVANGIRIAIGWASPPPDGHLADAQHVAAERLEADLSQRA